MKNGLLLMAVTIIAAMLPVSAQPGDPGGGDPGVPLEGTEILLTAGGLLAVRSMMKRKKLKPS